MFLSVLEKFEVSNPFVSLSLVVWCIYIGAVLGWIGVLFNKFVTGTVVRRLIRFEATSAEAAKTPGEMKIKFPLFLFFLRDGSSLRRTVKSSEETPEELEERAKRPFYKPEIRRPVNNQHFYIPEETLQCAEKRYSAGFSDILGFVIGAAALLVAAAVLYNYAIPYIMGMMNSFLG